MTSDPTPPKVIEHRIQNQKACIIFVHGFTGSNALTWGKFPDLLIGTPELAAWDIVSLGYSTALIPDLVGIWSADAPIDKLATLFRTTVNFGLQRYQSIAILAHSMGGLVVQRAFVDDADFSQRVSHLFLFGTPSNGLKKTSLVTFLKRQLRDMKFGSAFITGLRAQWQTKFSAGFPFTFWTVAGERDEFVPSTSSLEVFPEDRRAVIPGNHLEIVKPDDQKHLGFQLVTKTLLGKAAPAGPWNSANVAVESRNFLKAIHILEDHVDELDEPGLVRLALAYEAVGRSADAIKVLEEKGKDRTDAMGTLAGRFKRRWIVERRKQDYDRALKLYSDAMALSTNVPDQLYYHTINVAFLNFAVGNTDAAREIAKKAFTYAEQGNSILWRCATQGEASLILGNDDAAIAAYGKAIDTAPAAREIESMYQQAVWIADLRRDRLLAEKLEGVFRPKIAATAA
jgi:pimeloyl-ACP methyl ester carboxylesterase